MRVQSIFFNRMLSECFAIEFGFGNTFHIKKFVFNFRNYNCFNFYLRKKPYVCVYMSVCVCNSKSLFRGLSFFIIWTASYARQFKRIWLQVKWFFVSIFQAIPTEYGVLYVFNIWKRAGKSNKVKYVRNVLCLQIENTKKFKEFQFFSNTFPVKHINILPATIWATNIHTFVHMVVCDVRLCEFKANIVCEHYFNWSLHSFLALMKLIFWQI